VNLTSESPGIKAQGGRGPTALPSANPTPPGVFRLLFCQRFACSHLEYEQQLFSRCLHWHVRLCAKLLARLNSRFFLEDIGLVRDLATAASHSEVLTELNRFYGRNVRDQNWVRKNFLLRISGKRVLRLSRNLFSNGMEQPSKP
jgi:hypothetical protein